MLLFQMSNYDKTTLDAEAEAILCQCLDTQVRRRSPKSWRVSDYIHSFSPYIGLFLMALGLFVLILFMNEASGSRLRAAIVSIVLGVILFWGGRKKNGYIITKIIARKCLKLFRSLDYTNQPCNLHFNENGMNIASAQEEKLIPYNQMLDIIESEHLWLLDFGDIKKPMMILLQKQDLISGDPHEFMPYIRQKISAG